MITAALKQFRNPQNIRYMTQYNVTGLGPGEARNVTINTAHPHGGAKNVILAYWINNTPPGAVSFKLAGGESFGGVLLSTGDEDFYDGIGIAISPNKVSSDNTTLTITIKDTYYYTDQIRFAVFVLTGELNQDNIYDGRYSTRFTDNLYNSGTTLDVPAEGCAVSIVMLGTTSGTINYSGCDFTESATLFTGCKVGILQTIPSFTTIDCFPTISGSSAYWSVASSYGR